MTCRICTANDEAALVEQMAEAMWDTQRSSTLEDEWRSWDRAGPYWQSIMRQFAAASLNALRAGFAG